MRRQKLTNCPLNGEGGRHLAKVSREGGLVVWGKATHPEDRKRAPTTHPQRSPQRARCKGMPFPCVCD